jgi:hypothetical protein
VVFGGVSGLDKILMAGTFYVYLWFGVCFELARLLLVIQDRIIGKWLEHSILAKLRKRVQNFRTQIKLAFALELAFIVMGSVP